MAEGRCAEDGRAVTPEEQNRLAVMEGAAVPLAVRLVPTEGGQVSRASLQPSPKRGAGGQEPQALQPRQGAQTRTGLPGRARHGPREDGKARGQR